MPFTYTRPRNFPFVLSTVMYSRSEYVNFAGGEPLIYPYIIDLVAFIAENKIKPIILTNGVALKPELLAELNLTPLAQSPAYTLSGGERRRAEVHNESAALQVVGDVAGRVGGDRLGQAGLRRARDE